MATEFSHKLTGGSAALPALLDLIETWLRGQNVPPAEIARLMIAFDEVISNILKYGGAGHEQDIAIRIKVAEQAVTVLVSDTGKAFDPLDRPVPDTAAGIDDRAIGGLGIHLVVTLMDQVSYRREDGRNQLSFSRKYG